MTYQFDPDGDGHVTLICQGCGKKQGTRNMAVLPDGWCVSGMLMTSEEGEDTDAADLEAGRKLTQEVAGHFCSVECGTKALKTDRLLNLARECGGVVVLYSGVRLVLDGRRRHEEEEEFEGRPPMPKNRRCTECEANAVDWLWSPKCGGWHGVCSECEYAGKRLKCAACRGDRGKGKLDIENQKDDEGKGKGFRMPEGGAPI